jgi:hypothetical protein
MPQTPPLSTLLAGHRRWALAAAAAGLLGAAAPAQAADFWRRIDQPAPIASGLDGQPHEATCSGWPGTDPSYRFWTRKGKSSNLVVYFEGGGACWDDLTCTFGMGRGIPSAVPQFYNPALPPGSAPRDVSGLFDNQNPANPVKDWTVVYIPYCTGDVHIGSADRTYNNFGHPTKPLPSQFTIHHRGFDNFMVVMDWVQKNIAKPQQLLVTGASAGGYGASANFPWVAKAFPNAQLSVLADASQGVTTAGFEGGLPGRKSWNPQLAPWVFGNDPNAVLSGELLRVGAQAYPNGRFGQYTNVADEVQIGFYSVMKQYYGPGGTCPDPAADWSSQMLGRLASYTATLPNFRSYTNPGTDHTILRSPTYYASSTTGTPFANWLGTLINRSGAPWVDAVCPNCLVPIACNSVP